jgi:hypothetical protein
MCRPSRARQHNQHASEQHEKEAVQVVRGLSRRFNRRRDVERFLRDRESGRVKLRHADENGREKQRRKQPMIHSPGE